MALFVTTEGAVLTLPTVALTMKVHDQLSTAQLEAGQPLAIRSNYFIGNDQSKWRMNVPNYGEVAYRGVRAGIDLVYHGSNTGRLEYDFVVAPGASPDVTLDVEGADGLEVGNDGALEIRVGASVFRQPPPVAYQQVDGVRRERPAHYRLSGNAGVGFAIAQYDRSHPLVIDPPLLYSTYLGGSGDDEIRAMAVDASGAVYLCGSTSSANFPLTNPLQTTFGGGVSDVIVSKLMPAGDALAYSTYLGGGGEDFCRAIAVDSSGAVYLTGFTSSANFPLNNAFDSTFGGLPGDAFVVKLTPAGNALAYSTYLGGNADETGFGVAVDGSGAAYVTGFTLSSDFPVLNAVQPTQTGQNAFVTKFAPSGSALVYSTYLGGTGINGDEGDGVAVDGNGAAYVTGLTSSADFPVVGAYQATMRGPQDAFVAKFTPAGNALAYSTYLGGSDMEWATALTVDASGGAYVVGYTGSADFPLANAAQRTFAGGTYDAFVAKLTPAGNALAYATFLGGSGQDFARGVSVDPSGAAYVVGNTLSTNFPVADAFQANAGGAGDAFVVRLPPAGNPLSYSSYLGGSGVDVGFGVAIDGSGAAHVAGFTESTNLPVANALQATAGGSRDGFVAKISNAPLTIGPPSPTVPPRGAQAFTASGGTGTGYVWALATNASGGAIDAVTGAYTAGATGGVTDIARVTDSMSNAATVNIAVGPGITIQPPSTTVHAGAQVSFAAMGGSGTGYAWTLTANGSGGHIDSATGSYTAGTASGSDTVHVVDALGNGANATVTVAAEAMPDGGGNPGRGDSGCGCRIARADDSSSTAILALLLLTAMAAFRRRLCRPPSGDRLK